MRSRLFSPFVLIAAATFGLSGCDDSPSGNTGDPLTEEEAALIFEILFFLGFVDPFTAIPEPDGPFDGSVDEVVECFGGGGTVSVDLAYDGTYDPELEDGNIDAGGTLGFDDCVISDEEDFTATLSDDPGVDVDWDIVIEGGVVEYDIGFDGGIEFTTDDDRSGHCDVDFLVEVLENTDGADFDFSGSLCGVDVSGFGFAL